MRTVPVVLRFDDTYVGSVVSINDPLLTVRFDSERASLPTMS